MVASIRDITRDHRDHALGERSSSVLRALADFDTFALEPHTAQEILEYACRSLCERGVCMMSWIGYVRADSERSVTPVASAGGGRTYLDTLRVSWGSSDTGIGPVGRAIRSRKMVVEIGRASCRERVCQYV